MTTPNYDFFTGGDSQSMYNALSSYGVPQQDFLPQSVSASATPTASVAGSYTADPSQNYFSKLLLGERGFNPDGSITQAASPVLTGIQAFSGLANAWMGKQQLDLARDSLNTSRQQFAANFNNQAQTTNTRLEDRQRARVASNPGAYESVGSYLDRNRVSGV